MKVTDLLHHDHEHVSTLFTEFSALRRTEGDARRAMMDLIADELSTHAQLEEEIFYPALRGHSASLGEAEREHAQVKEILADLQGADPTSELFTQKFMDLRDAVLHHVAEEESELFGDAERLGETGLDELGRRMTERKGALQAESAPHRARPAPLAPRKIA